MPFAVGKNGLRVVALAAIFVAYFFLYGNTAFQPRVFNLDFMAFYCGGEVANQSRDPYLIEPLRSCEHRVGSVFRKGSQLAVPDPLPPYDIAVFRPVARLPYAVASPLWLLIVAATCIASIGLVRRMSGLSWTTVSAAMLLPLGYVCGYLGQVAPISILGLLLLANAFRRGSYVQSLFGALLASTEPHLALFAVVACLLFAARTIKLGVLTASAICGVATLAFVPRQIVREYFTSVLPAHLVSEINNRDQFGTAYYLHLLGLTESTAIHVAEAVFAIALLVALVRFRAMRGAFSPEIALLGGSCFALAFSPYYHLTQIALAGPLALLIWSQTRGRIAGWSTVALAVPWLQYALVVAVAPLALAAFATLAKRLVGLRPTLGVALGTFALLLCAAAGFEQVRANPGPILTLRGSPTALAEVSWRQAVDWSDTADPLLFVFAKLPDHAALLAVASIAVFARRRACCNVPRSLYATVTVSQAKP